VGGVSRCPVVAAYANGAYHHAPDWYRRFLYVEERERGLDAVEDLATPGTFEFDLARSDAVLVFAAEAEPVDTHALAPLRSAAAVQGNAAVAVLAAVRALFAGEAARRRRFPSRLHRAADAYLVRRGDGASVIAGYPWFTDWGRDTFVALRGLCLAGDRLDVARDVLALWARSVSEGMVANTFAEETDAPAYGSVDASLWFVVAAHEYLEEMKRRRKRVAKAERDVLEAAVESILEHYAQGARYGIRLDADGLLAAGVAGLQLTWMDAKVGDDVVTPAHREAGRGAGALAQCAARGARVHRSLGRAAGSRAPFVPRQVLERRDRRAIRRRRRRSRPRGGGSDDSPEHAVRRRRSAVPAARRRTRRERARHRRAAAVDTARPTHAVAT
jgi:predicted glycogen debranching enzyme